MKDSRISVAKESYPFIGLAALMALVFALLGYDVAALVSLALAIFVVFFFRDPERVSPDEEDVLVSPADGKIIKIEKVFDDRYLMEHVYKISIFMNVFNVHVNRIPYPGTVARINYSPGHFFSANTERGALENEANALIISTGSGIQYGVVQVAGLIARRIVCWAEKGDTFSRGQRFGLICFGSRVDLYLPLKLQLEVLPGQKVKAGETVLGYLS